MTQLEEQRIKKYLHDVEAYLDDLPPHVREGELQRLRAQIERDLGDLRNAPSNDREVEEALRRLELAAAPGPVAIPSPRPLNIPRPPSLALSQGEWLGVCAGLAAYAGMDPFQIRLAAVVLGLLTGPLALIAYLAMFALMRVSTVDSDLPRLEPIRMAIGIAATVATALAIYVVAQLLVVVILHIYGNVMHPLQATLAPAWGWYSAHSGAIFALALLCALPLAILGSLPMHLGWDGTMVKLAQATLALYAIVACFGVASVFVGALLQIIGVNTGVVLAATP